MAEATPNSKDDVVTMEEESTSFTMQSVLDVWDCITHCAEPEDYHELTEKLQQAVELERQAETATVDTQPSSTVPALEVQSSDYNFAEHALMGDNLMLRWSDHSRKRAGGWMLTLANGANLTYGAINALGGDFFGTVEPISSGGTVEEQRRRFRAAFATLADVRGGEDTAAKIQGIMDKETSTIAQLSQGGTADIQPVSLPNLSAPITKISGRVYESLKKSDKLLSDEDFDLNMATRQGGMLSYIALAQLNLDHFGDDGKAAYSAGHFCALETAAAGDLERAYAMNAFADHFLGDAFASGHFRTPRRKLHLDLTGDIQTKIDGLVALLKINSKYAMAAILFSNMGSTFGEIDGAMAPDLCSKYMHDEDNARGLWVTNPRGDKWKAYGDAKLFDPDNGANRRLMKEALQASADEVFQAFENKSVHRDEDEYAALQIAPNREVVELNHAPLFNSEGHNRSDWSNPGCRTYNDPMSWNQKGYVWLSTSFRNSDYFKSLYLV